jgi:transcriptional regulator with XRE-family HTH domain
MAERALVEKCWSACGGRWRSWQLQELSSSPQRLRALREQAALTQNELATIFSEDGRQVSAAAVSSWERPKEPVRLPEHWAEPYARLPTLTGSPRRLVPANRLTPEQDDERGRLLAELTALIDQARGGPDPADLARAASHRSWYFADSGPVVIVVPDVDAGDGAGRRRPRGAALPPGLVRGGR